MKNESDTNISRNHKNVIAHINDRINIFSTKRNDISVIKNINIKENIKSQNAQIIILFDINLTKRFFGNNKWLSSFHSSIIAQIP